MEQNLILEQLQIQISELNNKVVRLEYLCNQQRRCKNIKQLTIDTLDWIDEEIKIQEQQLNKRKAKKVEIGRIELEEKIKELKEKNDIVKDLLKIIKYIEYKL